MTVIGFKKTFKGNEGAKPIVAKAITIAPVFVYGSVMIRGADDLCSVSFDA